MNPYRLSNLSPKANLKLGYLNYTNSLCFTSNRNKHRGDKIVKYLQCNCSGKGCTPTTLRHLKLNYRKLGKHCTCTLNITRKNGCIIANYFATHYNHKLDKAHRIRIPFSKFDKAEVATRLKMGISFQKIRADFVH